VMLMHPHDADCVYIVPVESDKFRCTQRDIYEFTIPEMRAVPGRPSTGGCPKKGIRNGITRCHVVRFP